MRMGRVIAIFTCVLLGAASGYFVAPFVAMSVVRSSEPDLFAEFMFFLVDNSTVCNCENQPSAEKLKTMRNDLSILQGWRARNPKSEMLAQEAGLTRVRLSRIERALGQQNEANQDMKDAQKEFEALGWRNVSPEHLVALTKQLDYGYAQPSPNGKAVVATQNSSR
jgi:hypothetical protein